MEIYGLGLVAFCMLVGSFIGRIVGNIIGVNGDMGGVGFAMLLLIIISNNMEDSGNKLSEKTSRGINLLSSLYIPIIVAMSAIQDVVSAFKGGLVPLLAGLIATIVGLYLVPVISKLGEVKVTKGLKGYLEVRHD